LSGLEVSVVCLGCFDRGAEWVGGYADVVQTQGKARISFGPEWGRGVFGVDGGLVFVSSSDQFSTGVVGRGVLTCGLATAYVRGGQTFGRAGLPFLEIGVLLK